MQKTFKLILRNTDDGHHRARHTDTRWPHSEKQVPQFLPLLLEAEDKCISCWKGPRSTSNNRCHQVYALYSCSCSRWKLTLEATLPAVPVTGILLAIWGSLEVHKLELLGWHWTGRCTPDAPRALQPLTGTQLMEPAQSKTLRTNLCGHWFLTTVFLSRFALTEPPITIIC